MINTDRPITSIEEDRFGFSQYAEAVARPLVSATGPASFAIGIEGPWGYGKTSLLNLIRAHIERSTSELPEKEKPIVISFNPWWLSDAHDLTNVFFRKIAAPLDKLLTQSHGLGKKLRAVGARASKAMPLIGALADVVASGAVPGIPAIPAIGSALSAFGSAVTVDDTLDRAYQEACDALRVRKRRIIVFIDDLDRLEPDDVRSMLKLIKSVADLPYVTYVLAYARTTIDSALPNPLSSDDPKYLEKIVQATFPTPSVSRARLDLLIQDELYVIGANVDLRDRYRWFQIYTDIVQPLVRSPRDATRFLNSFRILWPVMEKEVDFTDMVAIEAIRLFAQSIYDFIRKNGPTLTGVDPYHGMGDHGENAAKALLRSVSA